MEKLLTLIDANNVGYNGQHQPVKLNDQGIEVQSTIYTLNRVRELIAANPTGRVAMVYDGHAQFRYDILPTYKGTRSNSELKVAVRRSYKRSVGLTRKLLGDLGVPCVTHPNAEADDVAAFNSSMMADNWMRSDFTHLLLVSDDEDWLQLANERTSVLNQGIQYNPAMLQDKYGFPHTQIAMYKAMMGDTSDNICPIGGFGKKGAAEFCKQHRSMGDFMLQAEACGIPDGKKHNRLYFNELVKDKHGNEMGVQDRFAQNMSMIDLLHDHKIDWNKIEVEEGEYNYEGVSVGLEMVNHIAALHQQGEWMKPFVSHKNLKASK